jgi:hypothetical protein
MSDSEWDEGRAECTHHENARVFALRGVGPDAPTCSDWTAWHDARNGGSRTRTVREDGGGIAAQKDRWKRKRHEERSRAIYTNQWRDSTVARTGSR